MNNALRILEDAQGAPLCSEDLSALIAAALAELQSYEQARRRREHHLTCLWACSPQLHWIADRENDLVWVSRAWTELTGRPIQEALGHGWRQFVHPDDADQYFAAAREARFASGSYDLRFRGLTADGSYRWLRTRAVGRDDETAGAAFVYGVTEDVHDQVVAEAALERLVERSELVGLATNDIIWDRDFDANQLTWSRAIGAFCEDPAEATWTWWENNIHPADREPTLASLRAFLADSAAPRWQLEYRFRRPDGSYATFLDRCYVLRRDDGSPRRMIGAMTDLSARVEADAKIKQLQSELIHVSRLSAMGAMAATLAHELNQPLAAATNWVGVASVLVQRSADVPEQAGSALDQARASIARAGEIIRRIRTMLWRGNNNREVHDIRALIDESLRLALIGATASGIACRVVAHSIDIFVDRVQIEQVLLNLVRNAIEAMASQSRRELLITARPNGEFAEVTVADTGPGLDEELQARLFTPFVTTKDQGLGVGLSISRTIIEEHGGSIRAIVNPDGGTTFVFTLPRARQVSEDGAR
ncbi:PAS domain-containing sensor histidine kinase [Sphingomonas parva]|uniref:PAS domain-containing sensor histidine kinase n=1 Tax=Sphingomonas parva TaxID=2555898 RepID=UPI001CDB8F52|nr:PAS domain-containing protein [Sphingomonas parva]